MLQGLQWTYQLKRDRCIWLRLLALLRVTEHYAEYLGSVNIYLRCWETCIAYPRGLLLVLLHDFRCVYTLLTLKCLSSQSKLSKVRKCQNSRSSPSPLSCLGSCCFTAYTSTKALISSSYANCFKKLKSLVCNLKWDPDALITSREKKKGIKW